VPLKVLVIGRGLIGGALAELLSRRGHQVLTTGQLVPVHRGIRRPADLATPRGLDALVRSVRSYRPDATVLAHGPTDVDWCEVQPREAIEAHAQPAEALAEIGVAPILVSSDAVFDGSLPIYDETDETTPANAYGYAKLAAERVVAAVSGGSIVRVSVVYGGRGRRLTFADQCADAIRLGLAIKVPYDQFFTPVFIDDACCALTAVVESRERPDLLHVGGPERISRLDFARLLERLSGSAGEHFIAAPRAETCWASRSPNSCLRSTRANQLRGLPLVPIDPAAGLAKLLDRPDPISRPA